MMAAIVVQAAPTVAETRFLLELGENEPTIAGVVGWLDLEEDHFPEMLDRMKQYPKFVGLRPMLHDLEDDAWIVRPKVLQSLAYMAECDVPLDLLIRPRHLPYVMSMMEQVPDLRAVIDHLAKPEIKNGNLQPWANQMERLSGNPNLYCKLSGMVTEADWDTWSYEDFIPYVHHIVQCFGYERVMFGSDWPVSLLASPNYKTVVNVLKFTLPTTISSEDSEWVWGRTAAAFYRLDEM